MLIPKQLIGGEGKPKQKTSDAPSGSFFDAIQKLDEISKKAASAPIKHKVETAYGSFDVEHKGLWNKRARDKYISMIEDEGRKEGWRREDGTVADTKAPDFSKTTPKQYEQAKKAVNARPQPAKPEPKPRINSSAQSRIDAFDQSRIDASPEKEYTGGDARLSRTAQSGRGMNATQQRRLTPQDQAVDVSAETKKNLQKFEDDLLNKIDFLGVRGAAKNVIANVAKGNENAYTYDPVLGMITGAASDAMTPLASFESAVGNMYDPTATGEERLGAIGNAGMYALGAAGNLTAARGAVGNLKAFRQGRQVAKAARVAGATEPASGAVTPPSPNAPTSQADNFSDAIGAPRAAGQGADDVSGIVPKPGAVKPTTPEASPSAGAVSADNLDTRFDPERYPREPRGNYKWEFEETPGEYRDGVYSRVNQETGSTVKGNILNTQSNVDQEYLVNNLRHVGLVEPDGTLVTSHTTNDPARVVKLLDEGVLMGDRGDDLGFGLYGGDPKRWGDRGGTQIPLRIKGKLLDMADMAFGDRLGESEIRQLIDRGVYGGFTSPRGGSPQLVVWDKRLLENFDELKSQYVPKESQSVSTTSPQPDIPTARPAQAAEDVPATSARKAMVADDRANMGLGELDDAVRKSFGESLDNARTKGYDGAWATREAEAVTAKPRALNDEETAGMVDAMAGLKKQHKSVLEQIANETDPAKLDRLRDDLAGIEKQFDGISEAVKLSGTQKGRALASQKITLNEDFDLISVKSQAKAKKGEDLTAKETAKYEDLVNRLTEVDAKIADLELKNIDLQNALDSMPKGAKPGRRIARTDVEIKAARTDALSKWSKSVTSSPMGAGIDPTAYDYKALGQYIATFAEEGVGKVEDVIRAAIASAKASGIEISEADAKKGLLEWGTPKKSNREMDVAIFQRDRLRKEIRSSIQSHEESRLKRAAREITALPRAAQSTLDFSATLRQGILLGAGNPMKAAWAYGKALRATFDPVYSAKLDRLLYSTPQALRRKRAKLYLANGEATNLAEEAFMSNWINKIPGVGILTKGAERHYTTFLNQLRSTVFDAEMARYPDMSVDQQKALADFVNVATGRGRVPDGAAEFLSHGFFSPRFTASRIQAPLDAIGVTPNGRAMWKSPAARAQMLKSWGSMIATGATMAALAKEFGAEVELADVDSSDWGKIKIGDTRYDIWGGFLPQVRMLARLAKLGKSGNKAGYKEAGRDIVADFLKYKMSPNANMIDAAISKQDAVGNPMFINKEGEVTPGAIVEDLPKFYSPLIVKELADLWGLSFDVDALEFKVESNTPMGAKVAGTILAPHGVGVNTYKKK